MKSELYPRRLSLLAAAVLCLCAAACTKIPPPEPVPDLTYATLIEVIESQIDEKLDCPDYLPEIETDPGDELVCFKSDKRTEILAWQILERIQPDAKQGLNVGLQWDQMPDVTLNDGCVVEVITNQQTIQYLRAPESEEKGQAILWFIDRASCDDGTLIALRSNR